MITRKALIEKLNSLNPDTLLFDGNRRSHPRSGGYRAVAAIESLKKFIGYETFCQKTHVTKRGTVKENPKWFKQLFTELEWGSGDIQVGIVLYHLCAK